MTDLVEQVAQAIARQQGFSDPAPYRGQAQAAIATVLGAMKEPSGEMIVSGERSHTEWGSYTVVGVWQAMLQAFASEHDVEIG